MYSSWFEGSKAWIRWEINWYNTVPRLWRSSAWSCVHVRYSRAAWRSLQDGLEAGLCWPRKWHPPCWRRPMGVRSYFCFLHLFRTSLPRCSLNLFRFWCFENPASSREFVSCVKSIKILSSVEVQQMSLDGDLGCIPQTQACSASDDANAWRAWRKY